MRIKYKFIAVMSLLILLIITTMGAVIISNRTIESQREIILRNRVISMVIGPELSFYVGEYSTFNFDFVVNYTDSVMEEHEGRLMHMRLINKEGGVFFDSDDAKAGRKYTGPPRIIEDEKALKYIKAEKMLVDFIDFEGDRVLRVLTHEINRNERFYMNSAEFIFSLDEVIEEQNEIIASFASLFAVFIGVGILLSFFFAEMFTKPIQRLSDAAEKIRKGDMDVRTNVRSDDELGDLASVFDGMAKEIKKSREGLEDQVRDRTRELEESKKNLEKSKKDLEIMNKDLEKFNKLAVGRELKMVELKKKVRELESRSDSTKMTDHEPGK